MAYVSIQATCALIIAALCLRLRLLGVKRSVLLAAILNLGCIWMTALGPSTESSTYTLLGPTVVTLLVLAPPNRSHLTWILAGVAVGLLYLPTFALIFPGGKNIQLLGPQPIGSLLAFVVLLVENWPHLHRYSESLSQAD
jgi:hypothetical protein